MPSSVWKTSEIIGYSVQATDGAIGSVSDLLFDDARWGLRWAVIDTGNWLPGRRVLLPASELGPPDETAREVPVAATREQVKDSPGIGADEPVSRQLESSIHTHYGWTPYWSLGTAYPLDPAGYFTSAGGVPLVPSDPAPNADVPPADRKQQGDPHLRSIDEVTGYYVKASDGSIGHVEDFMAEEETWALRYLMVDTRNWLPGRTVLISPDWAREIDWHERQVFLDVTREKVKNSPEYAPERKLDRGHEATLYGHYGYPPYWL